ncbi:MAG TPA: TetR family transcriptional regulator [Actinomycetota bacterium]|nr:TetR family transcriptional regulator [Actinomycetota bacterium]
MLKAVQEAPTTKQRIVAAALETVKEEGFAGTSARSIARRGDFNQALIFYHFGTLNDLLLAALDHTSNERMNRYREALAGVSEVPDLIGVATGLYREDLESGHITVVSEMIAGSLARPDLAPEVVARMDPWVDFAEEFIRDVLVRMGLDSVIPARTAAFAVVAMIFGVNLLSHLDEDNSRAEALFEMGSRLAQVLLPAGAQP